MINFTLVLIFLLSNSFAFTQQINIKFENLNQEKATLHSLSGETSEFVDTLSVINEGTFQFNLDEMHSGFYRLSFNNNTRIDFVYDDDDVIIQTDAENTLEHTDIIQSDENTIYYSFIKLSKEYKTKTELLQLILARYPKEDDYYQTTKEKLIQIQKEYLNFVNAASQVNSNLLK